MALLSETERARAETLARAIEHVSLASHPDFQDIFVEALKFPPGTAAEAPPPPPRKTRAVMERRSSV